MPGKESITTEFTLKSVEELTTWLETDLLKGLSEEEVLKRRHTFGANILKKGSSKSVIRILAEQFLSPIVWILVLAAAASFVFEEWAEGIAVAVLIVINTVIGFLMEWQAVRSMDALRKLSRASVRVLREGRLHTLDSMDLVPGDIMLLEAGDLVTADARVVQVLRLQIEEEPFLPGEPLAGAPDDLASVRRKRGREICCTCIQRIETKHLDRLIRLLHPLSPSRRRQKQPA